MQRRNLKDLEQEIIERLLSIKFEGAEGLKHQLSGCLASDAGDIDGYGSIYLHPLVNQPATTTSRVPVEAEFTDLDGVPIFVLLHVADGFMHELEIYKADGGKIIQQIKPKGLKVRVRD